MIVIAHTKKKSISIVAMLAIATLGIAGASYAAPTELNVSKDTYIQSGTNGNTPYGSSTTVQLKNAYGNTNSGDSHRKTYLGFDATSVTPSTITSATLSLTVASNSIGNNNDNYSYTFHVYGLANAQDGWSESTLTWNNAASYGNDTATAAGVIGATDLGTFSFNGYGGPAGTNITFTSAALTNFVKLDTNGTVSIVLVRDTQEYNTIPAGTPNLNNRNTLAQNFSTKENTTYGGAKLLVNSVAAVPEAGALTLIAPALGLLGLVTLRKSRKS